VSANSNIPHKAPQMKGLTFRRKYCVHRFGFRSAGIPRLVRLLLSALVLKSAMLAAPAMATTTSVTTGVDSSPILSGGSSLIVESAGSATNVSALSGGELFADWALQSSAEP
jgi:hypothetical protein